jgi:hypothetical protein
MATTQITPTTGRASPPPRPQVEGAEIVGNAHVPTGTCHQPTDPLHIQFGVTLCNDDNAPAYRNGDMVLVRALYAGERVEKGGDYLFARGVDKGLHGQPIAGTPLLLGRLKSSTRSHWTIQRYGRTRHLVLARRAWPTVYVVVGRYNTSNPALRAKVEASIRGAS